MSTTCHSDLVQGPPEGSLLPLLLAEQQQLTAVSRFAAMHEREELPLHGRHYRDLIPLEMPGDGQQFAFEVDLDCCSGCKACVTACHNLNGLEEEENWRRVGLLVGGNDQLPVIQHVTSSCHHCLEPSCLSGCPVAAYEKDDLTGIVRHLDDQCIGCQYCIFLCPYDVPQYSHEKGIVRKCDMCHDRLAVGEAPACVQACPNQAIRITLVDQQQVIQDSELNQFLPGAPDPNQTLPTTVYHGTRPLPRNMLPADYYSSAPQPAHWPLVVMLVLTQVSVGAFLVLQFFQPVLSLLGASHQVIEDYNHVLVQLRPWPQVAALLLGLVGMAASILHLGRPLYAFRAVIGLRTSWLSREIVGFSGFGFFAGIFTAGSLLLDPAESGIPATLGVLAAAAGVMAIGCSVMVYAVTSVPLWRRSSTAGRFLATMLLMGLPTTLLILCASAAWSSQLTLNDVLSDYRIPVCRGIILLAICKLALESSIFLQLASRRQTPLKQSAMLMVKQLNMVTTLRMVLGIVGGIVLPLVMLQETVLTAEAGFQPLFMVAWFIIIWSALLAGELLERSLYFRCAVSSRMPGGG